MGLHETFRLSIYETHLEEASFLYEQRGRFLDDPEVTLNEVAELEARLEAHLDGLALGGELAAAVCRERLQRDDAGAIHGSVRVLCRSAAPALALEQLSTLAEHAEPAVPAAVADALCLDFPRAWAGSVQAALPRAGAPLLSLLARLIGYQTWPSAGPALADAAAKVSASTDPATALHCAWALGELREASAQRWLLEQERSAPHAAAMAAAIALAKCGVTQTAAALTAQLGAVPEWIALPWAVTRHTDQRQLARLAQTAQTHGADALLALGIFGDSASLPQLLAALTDETLASSAAAALHLMLGVRVLEEVVVPAQVDETLDDDLASPEDADAPPVRPTTRQQLSHDPDVWRAAVEQGREHGPQARYLRMGHPLSASSTCLALQSTALPLRVRGLLADQLQLRQPSSEPYRATALVQQQRRLLAKLEHADWSQHDN